MDKNELQTKQDEMTVIDIAEKVELVSNANIVTKKNY